MVFDEYYDAREVVTKVINDDLLGPVKEDEILIGDRPSDYYILGKLYPLETNIDRNVESEKSSSEDCGDLEEEEVISLSGGKEPSSFGISISISKICKSFIIKTKAATYRRCSYQDVKDKIKLKDENYHNEVLWQRNAMPEQQLKIDVDDLKLGKTKLIALDNWLLVDIVYHRKMKNGDKIITISMKNTHKKIQDYLDWQEQIYFQPEMKIIEEKPGDFSPLEHKVELSSEPELQELDMLYSDVKQLASGHGCAYSVNIINGRHMIKSEFLPYKEVLQMKPSTDSSTDICSMKYLAEGGKNEIIPKLNLFMDEYEDWIQKQYDSIGKEFPYLDAANKNLSKCHDTLIRIRTSIKMLYDDIAFRAFQLANKAMYRQRYRKFPDSKVISWYPFQLAFFLQEIASFIDPQIKDRNKVDLLWFPTGGGKTEAYLGIAAFVIFLRRLRHENNSGGITVLMRYTMRLLTFQQFERAAAMICECEIIRREEKVSGDEISIGLWAGQALTPNKIKDAKKILDGEEVFGKGDVGNPIQIKKCPCCGSVINVDYYHVDMAYSRMLINCSSEKCEFHNGLPVYLIDEEIYRYKPTYLVATIDKFAQIALNEDCANLFGYENGEPCYIPPELIIQDELHLISGPLGTICGLYEPAIKKLCTYQGIQAKVIASTATIRNAKEQIRQLYNSDYSQFPPQGISINDSFFAKLSSRDEKPSRLYLGCMGIGVSPTTMMIRVMASLLFATRYLAEEDYSEKVVDSFWSLTTYFNSLRELGGAIVRVVDDIQDRYVFLRDSKFKNKYPIVKQKKKKFSRYKELTSREKSEDIGKVIQEELTIPYKADHSTNPYDFILASNMISVGVDVSRLGSMVVVGQPKKTAEYIQATSRVGRSTPGIVITTYNQGRSRDRSHYEQFVQYHESFYKFVEATSITPFADRARDRALHTLFVILCRYMISDLFGDKCASNFSKDMPHLDEVEDYIYDYVRQVDPEELEDVQYEIQDIEDEWEERIGRSGRLKYSRSVINDKIPTLFDDDYKEDSRFRVLNSMRSVETSVEIGLRE